jgi:hypothetical protein
MNLAERVLFKLKNSLNGEKTQADRINEGDAILRSIFAKEELLAAA